MELTVDASQAPRVLMFTFDYISCDKSYHLQDIYPMGPPHIVFTIPIPLYIILPLFITNPSSIEAAAHNLGSSKSACPLSVICR